MTTKSDQYHYVYKIIQLSTQREYIGIHSTSDFNDGYMGSGTLIAPAVEENPADFVKTIIWMGTSREQIEEIEASLVTEEYLLANFPEKTFNQVPGGKVSMDVVSKWSKKLNPERTLRGSRTKWNPNSQVSEEQWNAGYTTIGKVQSALAKAIRSGDWPEVLIGYKEQYREQFESVKKSKKINVTFDEFISKSTTSGMLKGELFKTQQYMLDGAYMKYYPDGRTEVQFETIRVTNITDILTPANKKTLQRRLQSHIPACCRKEFKKFSGLSDADILRLKKEELLSIIYSYYKEYPESLEILGKATRE